MRYPLLAAIALTAIILSACDDHQPLPTGPDVQTANQVLPTSYTRPQGTQRYIVKLRESAGDRSTARDRILTDHGGTLIRQYESVLDGRGFVAWLPPEAAAVLETSATVEYVERDEAVFPEATRSASTAGLWGLDRIDQRQGTTALDDTYTYYFTGSGVHLYIVDTGIDSTHSEFSGRMGTGGAIDGYVDTLGYHACPPGEDDGEEDPNGVPHGTRVAGVAAGSTYGVATAATIHSVRITCQYSATYSHMIDGLEWVIDNGSTPGVVNFSWNPDSNGVRDAINDVYDEGWLVFKAAGNDTASASPSASNQAYGSFVMGATNDDDELSDFSNYGSAVDLLAPGSDLRSAADGGGSVYAISGTSYAAPLAAATAALALDQDGSLTPGELAEILLESATTGELDSGTLNGSPNRLLYSLHLWTDFDGEEEIVEENYYTWSMDDAIGGSGSFTYQWLYSEGGPTWTVGTSQDYTQYLEEDDPDFTLEAVLTSGGATYSHTFVVLLCWNHENIQCEA